MIGDKHEMKLKQNEESMITKSPNLQQTSQKSSFNTQTVLKFFQMYMSGHYARLVLGFGQGAETESIKSRKVPSILLLPK